ncbi:MAG: hypothetical protein ACXU86_18700 [Archangium sp.]
MSRTAVLLVLFLAAPTTSAHAATKKGAASTRTSKKPAETTPAAPAPAEAKPSEPAPPAETKPSDVPVKPQEKPSQQEEPSMEFELLQPSTTTPESAHLIDPELERAISRRRTMLTVHQALGLTMAATLAATVVVGQLNINDVYRGGGDTGRYKGWHTGLAIASTSLFVGTGLLGVLAPTPFKKEFRWDTITFHKIFMSLATVGMLTQVVLGIVTANKEGQLSQVDLVTAHQIVGYATLGAVGAGALVIVF